MSATPVHMPHIIRWENIKEPREDYFVEYQPSSPQLPYAALTLVFLNPPSSETIPALMEHELSLWLQRYPVPIMVSACDQHDDTIDLAPHRPENRLMGYVDPITHDIVCEWRWMKNEELPEEQLTDDYRHRIYAGLPHITQSDIDRNVARHKSTVRAATWLAWAWAVIIPVLFLILQISVAFFATIVMLYAFTKLGVQALKLWGKWPESKYDKRRNDEERAMRHHHYHCKKNPEGFLRLKVENLRREEAERTRKEFEELRTGIGRDNG